LKGWQVVLQVLTPRSMRFTSCLTLVNEPRRPLRWCLNPLRAAGEPL
jgi:hypothetical protein